MTRGRGRTPVPDQPDPLAAINARQDQMDLYLVLVGLLAAVDADDENAYGILGYHRQFTTPSGKHYGGDDKEMWEDDWEGVAGNTLGPRFRAALSNYDHRLRLRTYVSKFRPHYDAYLSDTATDEDRLAALMEMFALWHGDLLRETYMQIRTKEQLGEQFFPQFVVDRLLKELFARYVAEHGQLAATSETAFWELHDLRTQYRNTGEPHHGQGPTYKILMALREYIHWVDVDNWHTLVDRYIDTPTAADFGDDQATFTPAQFAELIDAALAKSGTRAMAKRVYALVVAAKGTTNAVTADRIQRKANRRNP